jgi:hypothetical protein
VQSVASPTAPSIEDGETAGSDGGGSDASDALGSASLGDGADGATDGGSDTVDGGRLSSGGRLVDGSTDGEALGAADWKQPATTRAVVAATNRKGRRSGARPHLLALARFTGRQA